MSGPGDLAGFDAQNDFFSQPEHIENRDYPAKHIKEVSVSNLRVSILDTGFDSVNRFMVFKEGRGELIVVGARPSMGKSAFAFQVASYVAKTKNVLVYSMEMDSESIKARMVAAVTERSLKAIQKGELKSGEIAMANENINTLNLFIDDRCGVDVRTLRSSANAHHKKWPISLVVVDYLQLMKGRERANRNEEIGDISGELKSLAKDLKCPVLALSQLNRACDVRGRTDGDYMPMMADLRDSGNIEQDADAIMFLTRRYVYDGTHENEADFSVAKARNGEIGRFKMNFYGASCRFKDYTPPPPGPIYVPRGYRDDNG